MITVVFLSSTENLHIKHEHITSFRAALSSAENDKNVKFLREVKKLNKPEVENQRWSELSRADHCQHLKIW